MSREQGPASAGCDRGECRQEPIYDMLQQAMAVKEATA